MNQLELIVSKEATGAERRLLEQTAKRTEFQLKPLIGQILDGISIRQSDEKEDSNLHQATHGEYINTSRYLQFQFSDRIKHRIPDTHKSITLTNRPLISFLGNTVRTGSFGHSIEQYSEAIVTTDRYSKEFYGSILAGRTIKRATAYTVIHEMGHLLGVVPTSANRETAGQHCTNNCIMREGSSPQAIINHQKSLPQNGFCPDCIQDMRPR